MMDDQNAKIYQVLEAKLGTHPLYQQLMGYLQQRKAVPEISPEPAPTGASGAFSYGGDLPLPGILRFGRGADFGTLTHELTHAADRQLVDQFYGQLNSRKEPADRQFDQAYRKLLGWEGREKMVDALAPGWRAKEDPYRTSSTELGAYAVGNMAGRPAWSAPPHVDSTLATEAAILLELASRRKTP